VLVNTWLFVYVFYTFVLFFLLLRLSVTCVWALGRMLMPPATRAAVADIAPRMDKYKGLTLQAPKRSLLTTAKASRFSSAQSK
jgi:hypothetical protein